MSMIPPWTQVSFPTIVQLQLVEGTLHHSQPRCHYGHMEATPWFIGSTSTLGYGTSSDGNRWPMPHAVSVGVSYGFVLAPSCATNLTFLTSLLTQASYCALKGRGHSSAPLFLGLLLLCSFLYSYSPSTRFRKGFRFSPSEQLYYSTIMGKCNR